MKTLCSTLAILFLGAAALTAAPADPVARLHDLFDREWEARLREFPLFATSVGRHEYDARLPDVSPAAHRRQDRLWEGFLEELDDIPETALPHAERINARIFRRQLEDRLASDRFGEWQVPINADSGFHIGLARLPDEVPLRTTRDYDNYLARLEAIPTYVAQQVANMRVGLERGMTVPRVVLEGYDATIASHVVDTPEESVFWAPFRHLPPTIPASEHARLRAAGRRAILESAVPAYRAFLEFFRNEYRPQARETLAASELPDGIAYYRYLVRHFTTLDTSPEEIHQIGLREVTRIRGEMEEVIRQVGFDGSFEEFLRFLRTDPRFYAKSPEELLMRASYIAKRMDGKLPSLFGTLPRLPYGVAPVPDHLAPKYTSGRYVGAPYGSTQPGWYWVNTYNLPSRPLYTLEALTLHEAVPGHHLQVALGNELENLPGFRRFSYISAFGEGWGLYSERLGLEAGFYTDPYSNFGRLTYEMWRACRLVVDTGIHALGWSRQRTMDFLAANTALSLHEVRTETDRYISWPGQALAYKLGELEILKLRERAERALGEAFDIRRFHDAVLRNGSVPLTILEEEIDRFIDSERGRAKPGG